MILTIDIGNSNIVLGGVKDDQIVFEARLRTDSTKTSDEYCIDLKMLLDVYKVTTDEIEGAIIASVVPQVLNSVKTALKKLARDNFVHLSPSPVNVVLEYSHPPLSRRIEEVEKAMKE